MINFMRRQIPLVRPAGNAIRVSVVAGIGDPGLFSLEQVVAGIDDPANKDLIIERSAGIRDAGYSISDLISPWNGQSSDFLTNPARTGFSFT
jgi:hypothetical protein